MSNLRVQIIRDEHGLASLSEEWWGLWHRAAGLPFQSPAWLIPWWTIFHPGELCAVVVRDGCRMAAMAPFYLEAAHRLLPVGIALSDYLDVLLDPECPDALDAIPEAAQSVADWDVWCLEELPPGAAALSMRPVDGWQDAVQPQSASPVLCLPGTLEGLRGRVPPEKLRNLRSARRRADCCGGFALERVGQDRVPRFLTELFRLHDTRWASRGEAGGVFRDDLVRRFQREAAPGLYRAGLARFYLMHLTGKVVGAYYALRARDCEYAYLQGFDPEFGHESPGTVLVGYAIETAVADRCKEFHFLRGREPYKYSWGATDRWSLKRTLQRPVAEALHPLTGQSTVCQL